MLEKFRANVLKNSVYFVTDTHCAKGGEQNSETWRYLLTYEMIQSIVFLPANSVVDLPLVREQFTRSRTEEWKT